MPTISESGFLKHKKSRKMQELNEQSEKMSNAGDQTYRSSLRQTQKSEAKSILKTTVGGHDHGLTAQTSRVDFVSNDNDEANDTVAEMPKKKSGLEYPLKEQRVNSRGQSIVYEDYKARMRAITDKETKKNITERAQLGDMLLDPNEKEVIDRSTEEEKDQALFDSYITKGLVNIKNLVLKNPE